MVGESKPMERICLNIIRWGTYLILFTPLIISNAFFFPFVGLKSLYFMGLVEIIFFTWLFLIIFSPKYRPQLNLVLGSLILFLIILILSALFGVNPSYSFWSKFERMTGILMMLHLFFFFLVISSVFKKEDWQKIFAVSIFVGVIINFISLILKSPDVKEGSTIGNSSFLGTYLLFNLFLALYLILKSKGVLRIYSFFCFLVTFSFLFLSKARAAKLSFLGGLILLFLFWLIFRKEKKVRILGIFLLTFFLIGAISLIFFALQPGSFVYRKIVQIFSQETINSRFTIWKIALKGWLERPWLGWGPENFEFAFNKYYNPSLLTPEYAGHFWYDRTHNIIFDTLVTSGILGLLSYLVIFIIAFYFLWNPAPYAQHDLANQNTKSLGDGIDFWTSSVFTVLLISYFFQNLTVFDMVSSYMMFFLVLGFVAGLKKREIPDTKVKPINLTSLILLSILFLFSFSKFIISPLKTDAYVISALKSEPFSAERLSFYEKTLYTSPLGKYQIRQFLTGFSLGTVSEKIPGKEILKEFDFLVQELEKSIKECSIDYKSYLQLGQLYNFYSKLDPTKIQDAERILKRAIELSPTNQQGYWYLTETKIYQKKLKEALSLAEKAVELEPRLSMSHEKVIKIARLIGDPELVEKKIREATEINPAWKF